MALPSIIDAVEALPGFTRVLNTLPEPSRRLTVGGLYGSSSAAFVAALARRMERRFFVVVAENVADAERWLADLVLGATAVAYDAVMMRMYLTRWRLVPLFPGCVEYQRRGQRSRKLA